MPLSFLNPWFWFGALGLVAPLWLHLRRKQQKSLIQFSAVQFLTDQPAARRAPLRLRDAALLALRVLGLLLVLGAFAWPYLHRAGVAGIRESRVYLLDNTMSRQANNGFETDRARVIHELESAGQDVQVAVVELTAAPRLIAPFGIDRQAARQKVRALRPSFQRGSYLAAFRMANSLLANSLVKNKRIILLGDNQRNQWDENGSVPPFLGNAQIELPKSTAPSLPNLWLADPHAQRVLPGEKSLVHLTVKLNHAGPAKTARVIVTANGQPVFSRSVPLEGQPETMLLQAQWQAARELPVRGEATIQGEPDALKADNSVFFSLDPLAEGKVALLAQSPYLRLALSPEVMRGQWAPRLLNPANLAPEMETQELADVLCIESGYLQSANARKLVHRYLDNRRGVFLLVNRMAPAVVAFLHELGFDLEPGEQSATQTPQHFGFICSTHPIFRPFLAPDFGNLLDIEVTQFARLRTVQGVPLVLGQSGAGLFFEGKNYPGKLFLLAFGLDREHTSWPIHPTFIPFLDLALQAARAERASPGVFEPGEVVRLDLPDGASGREAVLLHEGREVERVRIEQRRVQLPMPDQPGVYDLRYGAEGTGRMLCVNPSPKESQLVYAAPPNALKSWRSGDKAAGSIGGRIPGGQSMRVILQQRWWWWMLLAALLALAIESALADAKKEAA
ncbi:MAG TPA: BatA and WFA domain-containing protein [Verrucomicrobiae bacterium]|nr:BatA and WFA domain-containing protein [Verrucomicrobiae bacterium]